MIASRLASLLVLVTLAASLPPYAEANEAASVVLTAGSVAGAPGSEVEVPVHVRGAAGLGAIHVEVVFDPAVLEARGVAKGALASNAMMESSNRSGRVVVSVISVDAKAGASSYGVHGDGVLLSVRFAVKGAEGQTSALKLERVRAWEGASHHDVLLRTEAGLVTVASASGRPLPLLLGVGGLVLLFLAFRFVRRRPAAA